MRTGSPRPSPSTPHDEQVTPWGWLAALTGLALVLRAIGLDSGLWYDEIATLRESVREPLWQIITVFPSNNQHTLFSVLAHVSVAALGEHPWTLRLPAMVLGAATVPVLYLFARELTAPAEAWLASVLLAVAYHHVWFSQNARGYTALAFFTVLASWCLLRGLRQPTTAVWAGFGIAAALGIYTHLTMVFVVMSHALICAWALGLPGSTGERWARWRLPLFGFVVAGLVTALLYAPLLVGIRAFFVERPPHPEVATPAWALLELIRGLHLGVGAWTAGLAGAAVVLLGLVSYTRQDPIAAALFVLPGLITVAGAIALRRPIFPRFLFFLAGFAVLILVRGSLELGRAVSRTSSRRSPGLPTLGIALVLALVVGSLVALVPNYQMPKQDFDGALQYLDTHRAPSDAVVTVGATALVYRLYYGRPWDEMTSAEMLQQVRRTGRPVWVTHTLDEFIEAEIPALRQLLRDDCAPEAVFRGTLNDGDITVCRMAPLPTTGTP